MAAAASARRNCAEGLAGFANDVEPAPQPSGTRRVESEVAGIVDGAFAHLLQVERTRTLQHKSRDLTVSVPDMGQEPRRNSWCDGNRVVGRTDRGGRNRRNEPRQLLGKRLARGLDHGGEHDSGQSKKRATHPRKHKLLIERRSKIGPKLGRSSPTWTPPSQMISKLLSKSWTLYRPGA